MRIVAVLLVLAVLAGCRTSRLPNDPKEFPELLEPPKSGPSARVGYVAQLRGIGGSSAQGTVNVTEVDGVMTVRLNLQNVAPGIYTWALHESGNCTSTNGFSAGSAWVPSGVRKSPVDLLPEFNVADAQATFVTARVRGARIDGPGGVTGRSVLVYQGGSIQPIKAGVPNNAVACGVFDAARPLL